MTGKGSKRNMDDRGKNREDLGEPSQWITYALTQINERIDRIETDIRGLQVDIRGLQVDIRGLGTSVGKLQSVMWTATGVIIAVGVISTFLFGLGDLLTKIPFEITIRNQLSP